MSPFTTKQEIAAVGSAFFYAIAAISYTAAAAGGAKTVPTTWFLFFVTVLAGYVTYMSSPGQDRHWIKNICNTSDVLAVAIILVSVLYYGAYEQLTQPSDLWVALVWGIAMVYWLMTNRPKHANILFNLALVVAYIPLIMNMVKTGAHSEPYGTWIPVFFAALLGLYPPFSSKPKDGLSILYASRAIVSTGTALYLMLRIDGIL